MVIVPERVPPPRFVPSATVTLPLNWVAVFPWASCAVTWTAGAMAAPAVVLLGWTLKTSCVGVPTATLNAVLVAGVTPVAAAASVYPVPTLLMLRFAKVATPPTAVTPVVPARVPPPAFVPIATVTLLPNPVATLPCASSAVTWTAGAIVAPAVALLGSTLNTSCAAPPGVTLNPALGCVGRPVAAAVSVYPFPPLLTRGLASVAPPLTAVTVVVPDNAPPLGFAPSATVTFPVKVGSVLPSASSAVTWTAGVIAAPAVAALGWTGDTRGVAVAAATRKAVLRFVAIPF